MTKGVEQEVLYRHEMLTNPQAFLDARSAERAKNAGLYDDMKLLDGHRSEWFKQGTQAAAFFADKRSVTETELPVTLATVLAKNDGGRGLPARLPPMVSTARIFNMWRETLKEISANGSRKPSEMPLTRYYFAALPSLMRSALVLCSVARVRNTADTWWERMLHRLWGDQREETLDSDYHKRCLWLALCLSYEKFDDIRNQFALMASAAAVQKADCIGQLTDQFPIADIHNRLILLDDALHHELQIRSKDALCKAVETRIVPEKRHCRSVVVSMYMMVVKIARLHQKIRDAHYVTVYGSQQVGKSTLLELLLGLRRREGDAEKSHTYEPFPVILQDLTPQNQRAVNLICDLPGVNTENHEIRALQSMILGVAKQLIVLHSIGTDTHNLEVWGPLHGQKIPTIVLLAKANREFDERVNVSRMHGLATPFFDLGGKATLTMIVDDVAYTLCGDLPRGFTTAEEPLLFDPARGILAHPRLEVWMKTEPANLAPHEIHNLLRDEKEPPVTYRVMIGEVATAPVATQRQDCISRIQAEVRDEWSATDCALALQRWVENYGLQECTERRGAANVTEAWLLQNCPEVLDTPFALVQFVEELLDEDQSGVAGATRRANPALHPSPAVLSYQRGKAAWQSTVLQAKKTRDALLGHKDWQTLTDNNYVSRRNFHLYVPSVYCDVFANDKLKRDVLLRQNAVKLRGVGRDPKDGAIVLRDTEQSRGSVSAVFQRVDLDAVLDERDVRVLIALEWGFRSAAREHLELARLLTGLVPPEQ
jgi:energy-coupling factor transporter ATP-binding protein EcfA2